MAAGSPARGGTSSRPAAVPATSASRSAPPGSATPAASSAPSDPGAGGAPPSSAPPPSDQTSYAPSTQPASSPPDAGGGLSLSRDCPDQSTISALDLYTCTLTASGGTPPYQWTLFVNGNIDYGYSLPGVSAIGPGSPFATWTLTGKPFRGTYALTVTVNDSEPVIPQVTASTSFTLTVQ
jgi:hypothetical protein